MNTIKKIVAVVMVLAMALSLTACGDTSWIAKVDGETINSGLYIYYQAQGYSAAGYELMNQDINYYYYMYYGLSYLDDDINGITVREYMNNYALDMCKQYVVVEKLFDELSLSLDDDEKSLIQTQLRSVWNASSAEYEKAGISQSTVEKAITNAAKEQKIFNTYYEVGGLNGTTEEDIKGYLSDNYARVKFMTFNFKDSADDATDEARKNEANALAQSYLDRLLAGEEMNDLIAEYNASLEEAEEGNTKEDLPALGDESDNAAIEEEENPYLNEVIINNEGKSPSEKFVNYVFKEVKTGECKLIQDDVNIYVVQKLDILDRSDIYSGNRETFLKALFDSDFTKLLNNKLSGYSVEVNNKSVKRYKADAAIGNED